ncbi:putative U3 small nucleolar RNA-associated protein 7 [Drosera capensis]
MGVKAVKVVASSDEDMADDLKLKAKKYLRGESADLEKLPDKKLKGQLAVKEELYGRSAKTAAKVEKWLLPNEIGTLEAEGVEKTWRIKQEAIAHEVGLVSAKKVHDIVLPDLGPYTLDFAANGSIMAVAGQKGHLAIVDILNLNLIKEFQVREKVRDVAFLHNQEFFATAQKKYPYVYNNRGTEIHCLKEHGAVTRLQFLKNQNLIATINKFGQLRYQDVAQGTMVANHRTGMGPTNVMHLNPTNDVIALGHSRGTVTMWNATSPNPLVKMLCHHGPLTALAFHPNGNLMATAGMDRKLKLWDLRKYEVFQTLPAHVTSLDFSQNGLLATANGSFIRVLRDDTGSQNYSWYMTHCMVKGYQTRKVLFRPYDDALGIGHSMGWSSILIPGSGEPNFDSWVANPYETTKQRREKEVQSLLDKLPPESIMLDPSKIGTLKPPRKRDKPKKEDREAEMEEVLETVKNAPLKNKTKGRNKPSKVAAKKQELVSLVKRPFLEKNMKEEEELSKKKRKRIAEEPELPKSLQRFVRKTAE